MWTGRGRGQGERKYNIATNKRTAKGTKQTVTPSLPYPTPPMYFSTIRSTN